VSPATAVAVPRIPAVEQLQWLAPAPLWNAMTVGAASSGLTQPWIAELRSDAFVADFLGLVGGQSGASPDGMAETVPHRTVGGAAGAPFRLFQPMSQCYYIVSATLACRRPGIPDRAVKPARGERTSFVIRLVNADGEQAWVPAGGQGSTTAPAPGSPPTGQWQHATADALVDGEEQLPMHPALVAPFADAGSTAATLGMAAGADSTRTVFYGYVPVGRRERMVPALADPIGAVENFVPPTGISLVNPWLDELMARVILPWQNLTQQFSWPSNKPPQTFPGYASLFVLLDLADWLNTYLPNVYAAITTPGKSVTGAENDLLVLLQNTMVKRGGADVAVATELAQLQQYAPLVHGGNVPGAPDPPNNYDLTPPPKGPGANPPALASRASWFNPAKSLASATADTSGPSAQPPKLASSAGLADYALVALAQAASDPTAPKPVVPPELDGLIKIDPVSPPPGTSEPTYIIRAVFEHDPCRPVLSEASHQFVLARAVDADAPARKIRIQLPDITNMRQFQRGVGLEMPASLNRVISQVTPDMLKGQGLSGGSQQLGMICSFSLQIIFLCAFIVLFIFLLLLNIVFWWLPFLKICFPIPVNPGVPKGPQP
jgi:hypothetical protein